MVSRTHQKQQLSKLRSPASLPFQLITMTCSICLMVYTRILLVRVYYSEHYSGFVLFLLTVNMLPVMCKLCHTECMGVGI